MTGELILGLEEGVGGKLGWLEEDKTHLTIIAIFFSKYTLFG